MQVGVSGGQSLQNLLSQKGKEWCGSMTGPARLVEMVRGGTGNNKSLYEESTQEEAEVGQ